MWTSLAPGCLLFRSSGQRGSTPLNEELAYRKIDTGCCFLGTPAWLSCKNAFAWETDSQGIAMIYGQKNSF